jgi:ATP-dependent RNA helicase RhlE
VPLGFRGASSGCAAPLSRSFSKFLETTIHTLRLPEPVPRASARRRPIQERSINSSFDTLGLLPELLRAIAGQGYTQPTPIQLQAIPEVLAGRDLLAAAQTGTGKTAGFVLPLLQLLKTHKTKGSPDGRRPPRVLILTPTRELAAQVEESVRTYGAYLPTTSAVVYGGVGMQPQVTTLRRGVEILVATPGRLLDHVQQKTVDLSRIEILVLDEADRMLDMGFIRDIRRILALLPQQRQNLLFSATFTQEIRELAHSFLTDPVVVEVARRNAPSELVRQVAHPVDAGRKRELLSHLIGNGGWKQVLVFTRTKHGANRLAEQLRRDGISADAIHGNKSQSHRTRTLADFKEGELRVLVATDLAARGLDIEELPHVVNYDLSHVPEDYVHRIGRTGRAGVEGEAVALVCAEDRPLLEGIERLLCRSIEQRVVAGFEPGTGSAHAQPLSQPSRRPATPRPGARGAKERSARASARRPQSASRRRSDAVSGTRSGTTGQNSSGAAPQPRSGSAGQRRGPRSGSRPASASGDAARSAPSATPRAIKPDARRAQKKSAFAALLAGARRLIG